MAETSSIAWKLEQSGREVRKSGDILLLDHLHRLSMALQGECSLEGIDNNPSIPSEMRHHHKVAYLLYKTRPDRATMALTAAFSQQMLCWNVKHHHFSHPQLILPKGMLMTFGAVFTYYANHLLAHVSTLKLCLVGSIAPFLALSYSIIWSRLLDPGYHLPIAIGGAFSTAGLVALIFTGGNGEYGSESYAGVLLSTLPIGFGQSCYFVTFSHVA